MTLRHVFTVFGSPVAQGRPRFFRRGNFVGTYDPDKSRTWKQDVKASVLDQLNGAPEIHDGALGLQLFFHLPRPKSLPKRVVHHIKKPDVDNLAKAIKDALRGVVYRDDSQIATLVVRKQYGDPPRVVIELKEVHSIMEQEGRPTKTTVTKKPRKPRGPNKPKPQAETTEG